MALLRIDGARIAYDEHGQGTKGVPLVFLHACALGRHMWEPQIESLRGAHHVVAADMRGHGASDVPSFVTSIERMADDVHALVEALDLAPTVLVGHSMGGFVALSYARSHADRVIGLVLAHTRGRPDTKAETADLHRLVCTLRAGGPTALVEPMLPTLLSAGALSSNPHLVADVRKMIETTSAAGIASALSAIAARPDWGTLLAEITVPTLVLAGSADPAAVADAEAVRAAIRGARLEIVDGAGALFNLEQPEAFLTALKGFLGTLAPASAAPRAISTEADATTSRSVELRSPAFNEYCR